MSLSTLFIRDFAIVRSLDLELNKGLTVLTGETGAGKSILIDALALVLGTRAETENIRHGADSAEVIAGFDLEPQGDPAQWLAEQELTDDGACLVRRIIYRNKPTRAFVNGRQLTIQSLRELGDLLVDIHGQHEHQSLLRRESQRQVLDDYAGIQLKLRQLSRHYADYRQFSSRYADLSRQSDDRAARLDLLHYQVDELNKLGLASGEYRELEQEHTRLAHASDLLQGMQTALLALYDADEQPVNLVLTQCIQRLEALTDYAPDIAEVTALLNESLVQVEEAADQIRRKLDRTELDPQRLAWVDQRISSALDLARKHNCEADQLPAILVTLTQELSELDDADTDLDHLQQQIQHARLQYQLCAEEISAERAEAAARLSDQISDQMQELGMRGGQFKVDIATHQGEPTRYGYDRVEFQVSANPGQPLKLLTKVASGGELSRICLAIQVITAAVGRVPSLIFDEVDVGIGGGIAEIVGQKLRTLGNSRQVLCITHLPQVASQAGAHLQVHKQEADGVMVNITPLDDASRVDRMARMLGGIDITRQTRAHAEDMLSRTLQQPADS